MVTKVVNISGLGNLYAIRFRGQHNHNANPRLDTRYFPMYFVWWLEHFVWCQSWYIYIYIYILLIFLQLWL